MSNLQRSFWAGVPVPSANPATILQVGAICLRDGDAGQEVLLVKSSRGRWIVPKGWPMPGHTDAEAAKIEAWEEAGVSKGRVDRASFGGYVTEKRFEDGRALPCHVSVYRIDVQKTSRIYPEAPIRRRKWMPLKQAVKKVDDGGLKKLLLSLR